MKENEKDIQDILDKEIEADALGISDEIKDKNIADVEQAEEEGRYKKLISLEPNLWTYGSPIIIESGVLEKDQIMKRNVLTLNFTNIDERKIKDVYVTVFAGDKEGSTEQIEHQYSSLGQKYLATKGSNVKIPISNQEADTFQIKIEGVKFEDGSYWYKEDAICESAGAMENIEAFAEAKNKDYEDNYISAKEAIAQNDSGSIGNGIELLKRIEWYKKSSDLLKDAKRRYEVTKKNEERKVAREDGLKKRKQAMKKRYLTVLGVVIVTAILAALVAISFFIPNKKYNEAKKAVEDQNYSQAAEELSQLDGFLGSEDYLAQSYYNLGLEALEKSDEKTAFEYFEKSYNTSQESDYGLMAKAYLDYYTATEAQEAGDYDKALEYYTACANAASDFNLVNKASAGIAQINYIQKNYETAWNTIKNLYAKDKGYEEQYAEYGYGYAKELVDSEKITEGLEIYNQISKLTKEKNLNESVYNQAVKLGEDGKISESMELLSKIKKNYKKANKLYEDMYAFHDKVQLWIGEWRHKTKVNGEKTTYKIYISEVLYKGEMCLRIKDMNNDYLGFDTVISKKNRVTQLTIGTYQLKFKLKKYHNQKFILSLKEGNKMERRLKYDGHVYKSTYKKKS